MTVAVTIGVAAGTAVGEAIRAGVETTHEYVLQPSGPKPLTDDEKKHIGRVDQIPGWIEDHPDLEEEAERERNGEVLPKGRNHPGEARERVEQLERTIKTLEPVRRHRNPEAQAEIDRAIESAREYQRRLRELLGE